LQASLIPNETPRIAGWGFAAMWQPAHTVSGDFYDFALVDQGPLHGMVTADVPDRGMPAALFMALARSTIHASLSSARTPAESLTHANRLLCADTVRGMFVTVCYAQLDPASGELVCVNAGHNPPRFYQRSDDRLVELARTGMALGVDETCRYGQHVVNLDAGDFVLFYTDGVTEAADARQEGFCVGRLRQVVLEQCAASGTDIIAALRRALDAFVGVTPQFDDMAIEVIKRLCRAADHRFPPREQRASRQMAVFPLGTLLWQPTRLKAA